jgi:hypothetical protein
MTVAFFKTRGVPCRYTLLFVLLIVSGFLTSSCSMVSDVKKSTKRVVRNFKSSDEKLSKKMGIALFEDAAKVSDGTYAQMIQAGLATAIGEECPHLRLMRQGHDGYPVELAGNGKLADGRVDILNLIAQGRKHGFDAIVCGRLLDIGSTEKKHGFLWFRDVAHFLQVQIIVAVYDMETGAKLLDENFGREIEVDVMAGADGVKNAHASEINAAVEEMLPAIGEKICDIISARAWHGFVILTENGKITISAGEQAGLKAGDELALFSGARTIDGAGDQQFMVPGLRSGKIRLTNVFPETSEAILVEGETPTEGDVVRAQ